MVKISTILLIFYSVLLNGFPEPNSTCNVHIHGDSFPYLPQLRGIIDTPGLSQLFWTVDEPLSCETTLTAGIGQTVHLTVSMINFD